MKDVIICSIWLLFGLLTGVLCVVTGYIDNNIIDLVFGCMNIFLSGALALMLYVEIMFYKLKKKGEKE